METSGSGIIRSIYEGKEEATLETKEVHEGQKMKSQGRDDRQTVEPTAATRCRESKGCHTMYSKVK